MEIETTQFVRYYRDCMHLFSASIAESGRVDIGSVTWQNALKAMSSASYWLTDDTDALRDYFAEFGAWSRDELVAMDGRELNAMLVQEIAGTYRDREKAKDRGTLAAWEETCGGSLYESDSDEWFFLLA